MTLGDMTGCLPGVIACLEGIAVVGSRAFCPELRTWLWIVPSSENHNTRTADSQNTVRHSDRHQSLPTAAQGTLSTQNDSLVTSWWGNQLAAFCFTNYQSCLSFHSRLTNKGFSCTYMRIYVCGFEIISWRQILFKKKYGHVTINDLKNALLL